MMRCFYRFAIVLTLACLGANAQQQQEQQPPADATSTPKVAAPETSSPSPAAAPATPQATVSETSQAAVVERIFAQEAKLVEAMHRYNPLVETYIQNFKPDPELV